MEKIINKIIYSFILIFLLSSLFLVNVSFAGAAEDYMIYSAYVSAMKIEGFFDEETIEASVKNVMELVYGGSLGEVYDILLQNGLAGYEFKTIYDSSGIPSKIQVKDTFNNDKETQANFTSMASSSVGNSSTSSSTSTSGSSTSISGTGTSTSGSGTGTSSSTSSTSGSGSSTSTGTSSTSGSSSGSGSSSSVDSIDTEAYRPSISLPSESKGILETVLGALQVVGIITIVVSIALIGFNIILGSAEQKADYQQKLIGVLVGAILITGVVTIAQFVASIPGATGSDREYTSISSVKPTTTYNSASGSSNGGSSGSYGGETVDVSGIVDGENANSLQEAIAKVAASHWCASGTMGGRCLQWINDVAEKVASENGISVSTIVTRVYDCPDDIIDARARHIQKITSSTSYIPIGAAVYGDGSYSDSVGHCGIYIGNGQVVHNNASKGEPANITTTSLNNWVNRYAGNRRSLVGMVFRKHKLGK